MGGQPGRAPLGVVMQGVPSVETPALEERRGFGSPTLPLPATGPRCGVVHRGRPPFLVPTKALQGPAAALRPAVN